MRGLGRPDRARPVRRELVAADHQRPARGVPCAADFGLLSIDIVGNDYWVWKAIATSRPRVRVTEDNASVLPTESRVIAHDPQSRCSGTDYFAVSQLAVARFGEHKGYTLLGCDGSGTNAFLVYAPKGRGRFVAQTMSALYCPPAYATGTDTRATRS
jgi:hypothetical protein